MPYMNLRFNVWLLFWFQYPWEVIKKAWELGLVNSHIAADYGKKRDFIYLHVYCSHNHNKCCHVNICCRINELSLHTYSLRNDCERVLTAIE